MRKLFLLPLLAFVSIIFMGAGDVSAESGSTEKKCLVVGVAFYNLENLFDAINNNGKYDLEFSPEGARMWNAEKYEKKLSNLARAIVAMSTPETPFGPGIIGISEVENRGVVDDLVKRVDELLLSEGKEPWNLQVVHHDSPDRRGIDVGLLYNPLYFQVGNVTNHRLVIPDEPEFLTRDQLCVSGMMLDAPMGFIVNHWPSRLGGQAESSYLREAAGELSKHIADSLLKVDPGMGVVMMGDLNDDPQDKSCAVSFGAVRNKEDVAPGGFYNPFWWILDNGVGTLCYRGQWNLFDQIIVSENLLEGTSSGLQYWKATVHNHEFLRTKGGKYHNYPHRTFSGKEFLDGYSDHFPTEIFLIREISEDF